MAESLLLGKHLDKDSPIDSTIKAANRRATGFIVAVYALAVSLASLTVLLIAVGIQL